MLHNVDYVLEWCRKVTILRKGDHNTQMQATKCQLVAPAQPKHPKAWLAIIGVLLVYKPAYKLRETQQ